MAEKVKFSKYWPSFQKAARCPFVSFQNLSLWSRFQEHLQWESPLYLKSGLSLSLLSCDQELWSRDGIAKSISLNVKIAVASWKTMYLRESTKIFDNAVQKMPIWDANWNCHCLVLKTHHNNLNSIEISPDKIEN